MSKQEKRRAYEKKRYWHKRKERIKRGICLTCKSRKIHQGFSCYQCLLRKIAGFNFGKPARWEELHRLFESQNGKCYYTGDSIEIGVNASLDHILPVSRFPSRKHDITNVCWTTRQMNSFKSDSTIDELVLICKIIMERFGVK